MDMHETTREHKVSYDNCWPTGSFLLTIIPFDSHPVDNMAAKDRGEGRRQIMYCILLAGTKQERTVTEPWSHDSIVNKTGWK
jgi:hypothetical protein